MVTYSYHIRDLMLRYRMVLKKDDTEIKSKGGWADESPGSWAVQRLLLVRIHIP